MNIQKLQNQFVKLIERKYPIILGIPIIVISFLTFLMWSLGSQIDQVEKFHIIIIVIAIMTILAGGLFILSRQHTFSHIKEKTKIADEMRLLSNALEVTANSIIITN